MNLFSLFLGSSLLFAFDTISTGYPLATKCRLSIYFLVGSISCTPHGNILGNLAHFSNAYAVLTACILQ